MRALVLLCINQHIFKVPSFTNCKDIVLAKFKKGHMTLTTPLLGWFIILSYDMI